MSRRRSQSTPVERSIGPDCASASASSAESRPTPFVRSSQIALRSRIASYSSTDFGIDSQNFRASLVKSGRQILGDAADLDVARVHPRPAGHLEEVEDLVAVVEAVPEQRDRPELERGRAEPHEVRVDAVELGQRHPRPGRAARHLDPEELLDREHVEELVRVERDVVDPRRVRDRLPPRLVLHVLLEARVEVADDRADARDGLAVEVDDEPEDTVRGRVVRPEVDAQDVVEPVLLRIDLEDRRDGVRDARSLVDARRREDRHVSPRPRSERARRRAGSPCGGDAPPSPRA